MSAVWKNPPFEVSTVNSSDLWMAPIIHYLTHDELPDDKIEAHRLRAKAARFTILDAQLLKRSFSKPYPKCVTLEEANYILAKLYQGEYGNHARGRSLANLALAAGYYWPTMRSESTNYVRCCKSYQHFAQVSHLRP